MSENKPFQLTSLEQVEAITSPHRLEIIFTLEGVGPCSIPQLADLLARSVDSLYYHVKKLLDVGLMIQIGTQDRQGHREALFDLPGRPMVMPHDPEDPELVALSVKAVSSMLRLTQRGIRTALMSDQTIIRGEKRNFVANRSKGWVSRSELDEILSHMDRISEILRRNRDTEDTELVSVSLLLAPAHRHRRGRHERPMARVESALKLSPADQ